MNIHKTMKNQGVYQAIQGRLFESNIRGILLFNIPIKYTLWKGLLNTNNEYKLVHISAKEGIPTENRVGDQRHNAYSASKVRPSEDVNDYNFYPEDFADSEG